jgi:hypothetical protein
MKIGMDCLDGCGCKEAEILDVIGTKVLRVFLLATQSPLLTVYSPPPPPSKSGLKLVCNVNIDYAQKLERICTFIHSAHVLSWNF